MNNIIVLEPSSNLRALGRNALAGKWKIAITAVLIYQICVHAAGTDFGPAFRKDAGGAIR